MGNSTRKTVRFASLVAFDDAAVIADDLGDERKAKAVPLRFGGDERIEQVRLQVVRHARAVVLDLDHERQVDAGVAARDGEADAGTERGLQHDASRTRLGKLADGLDRILEQASGRPARACRDCPARAAATDRSPPTKRDAARRSRFR